jgi:hypothetical protein
LTEDKKRCQVKESQIRNELEADMKNIHDIFLLEKAAEEAEFSSQFDRMSVKCSVLRKKEKNALLKKSSKTLKLIQKLETDVAHIKERSVVQKRGNISSLRSFKY